MKSLCLQLNQVQQVLIFHWLEYLKILNLVQLSYENIISIKMNIIANNNFILLLVLIQEYISHFNYYYQTIIMMKPIDLYYLKLDNLFVTFIIRFNIKNY
ncbi:unnamed protein product [Paramecium primaurelia]|uniref:Transmembrane protein n=1 Tax=Paramecium primaurelia TaxID=5886 RepID=A0A8S1NY51_PARPR|nr:unnamed protein product [Paramecium primaurelia]